MIHMPRRSVTRFFIPLIDVMILLFCIFLLLPVFKEAPDNPDADAKKKSLNQEEELKKLRAELAELRKGQRGVAVRVLEVDPRGRHPVLLPKRGAAGSGLGGEGRGAGRPARARGEGPGRNGFARAGTALHHPLPAAGAGVRPADRQPVEGLRALVRQNALRPG